MSNNTPQPKKKHTVRNVAFGIFGFIVLIIIAVNLPSGDEPNQATVAANPPTASSEPEPKKAEAEKPKITKGQEQALRKAESYLEALPFSKKGLVKQLKHDEFSKDDAEWAAENVGADWNEQAVKKALSYLEVMPFSEDELADQLVHDGFTKKQAKHGASEAYKQ